MSSRQQPGIGAAVSGLIGLVIGVIVTLIIAGLVSTPWSLGQVLLAVGSASFVAAAAGAYGATRRATSARRA